MTTDFTILIFKIQTNGCTVALSPVPHSDSVPCMTFEWIGTALSKKVVILKYVLFSWYSPTEETALLTLNLNNFFTLSSKSVSSFL